MSAQGRLLQMLRCAHIDMKGGEPPFAAVCTKVSYAQLMYFAKSSERPDRF